MAPVKKPVLVIKKSHLFKPLIIQKTIKRPVTQYGSKNELTSAKRPCHMLNIEMKPNIELTQYAVSNANDETSKSKKNTSIYRRLNPIIDRNSYFCQSHGEMPEHQAKGLVQVGDMISSAEEFTNYANTQAKKWLFYYVTTNSRNSKLYKNYDELKPTYVDYKCRYFKGEHKSTSKGLRKVRVETIACPANIRMRRRGGETHFEVIRACHHHNHELSWALFNQLPHGYRLPQEVKDEIRDLTLFGLDPMLLRKYLQSKLGIDIYKTVYNYVAKVKKEAEKPDYPPEKVKDILSNMKFIKSKYGIPNKEVTKRVIERDINSKNTKVTYVTEDPFVDTEMIVDSLHKAEDNEMKANLWEETMVSEVEIDNYSVADNEDNEPKAETCASTLDDYDTEICVADDILTVEDTNHQYDSDTQILNLEHISSGDESTYKGYETVTYEIPTAEDIEEETFNYGNSIVHTNQEILGDSECVTDGIGQQKKQKRMREFLKIIPISQIGKGSLSGVANCNIQNITTVKNSRLRLHKNAIIVQPVDLGPVIIRKNNQELNKRFMKSLPAAVNDVLSLSNVTESNKLIGRHNVKDLANVNTNTNDQTIRSQRILNPETGEFTTTSIDEYTLGATRRDSTKSTFDYNDIDIESEYTELPLNQHIQEDSEDMKIEQTNLPIVNEDVLNFTQCPNHPFIKDRTDSPEVRCQRRHKELPEYKAKGLVKIGDVFESIEAFYSYANECAKQWFFYYMVCDSRNSRKSLRHNDKRASYVFFSCRFNKGKRTGVDNKGLRKRKPKTILCPGGVQLKSDTGTTSFRVTYVCHHHSHELSLDMFKQESHGYRLPQELKNEIHQLLWLKLDKEYVQRYVRSITGYNLRKTICNIHQRMQRTKMKIYMSPDKIKDMLIKIKEIKSTFPPVKHRTSSKKIVNPNKTKPTEQYETSRVETRLNNIQYDQEQSVHELEKSMGCETHIDTLGADHAKVTHDTSNMENEILNRVESEAFSHDVNKSRSSFSTRGNPKIVLAEGIINRYNIEFYIGLRCITTCLENLANNMKLSVLDLLKKLYQGEAVFNISVGRSGEYDRKSVQLKYIPLTIVFPYEKYKYINGLQEYKTMCSKYSDMTHKLKGVVDDLSTKLKSTESRSKNLELHNKELNENTEELEKALTLSNEALKSKQAQLVKSQALNKTLLNKNAELEKKLESLKTCFLSLEKSQVDT